MVTKQAVHPRTEIKSLLLLAGLTVIFYWKILFTHEYSLLTSNDNARQWYAWYQFATHWLHRGVLPLWDPYTLCGQLFIGEAQPGLFYPFNLLLFLLAGKPAGLDGHWIEGAVIFSTFLLAAFQYGLARALGLSPYAALVTAIGYAFAGFTGTIHFGHLGMFNSAIWTPVVFYFFLRAAQAPRRAPRLFLAMTAGLFLAIAILGGHIVPPMYAFAILALFAVYEIFFTEAAPAARRPAARRMALILLVVAVTAGGLAAVQLIPSAEYSRHAIRWVAAAEPQDFRGKIPYEIEGVYGVFPWYHLLGFLLPNLAYLNGIYVYSGLMTLLFGLIAILWAEGAYPRFFFYLLILSLLYILGNATILHGLAYAVVPFLYIARIAHRALFIVHFALTILAGFGAELIIHHLHERDYLPRVRRLMKYLIAMTALVLACILALAIYYYLEGQTAAKASALNNLFLFLLMLSLSVAALHTFVQRRLAMPMIKTLTLVVLVVDTFSPVNAAMPLKSQFDGRQNFEPGQYYRRTSILTHLLQDKDHYFRVDANGESTPPYGDVFNLFTTYGISPTMLKDYYRLRASHWYGAPVLNLLNVKYIISAKEIPGWEKVASDGDLALYMNKDYLPRAFLVPKAQRLGTEQAILDAINSGGFNPRATLFLAASDGTARPPEAESPTGNDNRPTPAAEADASSDVRILHYSPERIVMDVQAATSGYLFLSEIYYPGWQARVDGRAAPIIKANYTFRAVGITPGRHRVEWTFAPRSFKIGLIITLITAAAWLGAALAAKRYT